MRPGVKYSDHWLLAIETVFAEEFKYTAYTPAHGQNYRSVDGAYDRKQPK